MSATQIVTKAQWHAEGVRRFGGDLMKWRFACPECGRSAMSSDWHAAQAPIGAMASSCVSLWEAKIGMLPGSDCQYEGSVSTQTGGLIGISTKGGVTWVFDFAVDGLSIDKKVNDLMSDSLEVVPA